MSNMPLEQLAEEFNRLNFKHHNDISKSQSMSYLLCEQTCAFLCELIAARARIASLETAQEGLEGKLGKAVDALIHVRNPADKRECCMTEFHKGGDELMNHLADVVDTCLSNIRATGEENLSKERSDEKEEGK